MRNLMLFAVVPACVLAACSEAGPVDDPSDPTQIEAAMAELAMPQPGQYSTETELVEFAMPGVPEEDAAMMRQMIEMGASQGQNFCITQEQAEEGYREYLKAMQDFDESCDYTSFDASGGKLEASLTCNDPQGAKGKIEFSGTIGETEQDMLMTMDMENAELGQGMQMTMRNRTTRTGECEAADAG